MFRGRWTWVLVLLAPAAFLGAWRVTGQAAAGPCPSLQGTKLAVSLGGQMDPAYQGLPVFRRFTDLVVMVQARVLPRDGQLEISVTPANGSDALYRGAGAAGARNLEVTIPLHRGGAELPVGRYRVRGGLVSGPNCAGPAAEKEFFVVFNPFDPRDGVFQVPPGTPDREVAANVGSRVGILAGDDEFTWELGTYTGRIFKTAIEAVDGQASALVAAGTLRDLAHRQVRGYWPGLTDRQGRRDPRAPPDDPQWTSPWGQSVVSNLGKEDVRGQCYEFAAVLTALLRSVGIPATVVTAIDPGPFPYPYNLEWEVSWAFHVWSEFVADRTWWATDPTYPTGVPYLEPFASGPGPQPRTGSFFAAAVNSDAVRITAEYGGVRRDVTKEYRGESEEDVLAPSPLDGGVRSRHILVQEEREWLLETERSPRSRPTSC